MDGREKSGGRDRTEAFRRFGNHRMGHGVSGPSGDSPFKGYTLTVRGGLGETSEGRSRPPRSSSMYRGMYSSPGMDTPDPPPAINCNCAVHRSHSPFAGRSRRPTG